MSPNVNYLSRSHGESESMPEEQKNSFGGSERRNRQRLPLHWNVYIFGEADSSPMSGRIRDLSSQGFYCVAERPLTPGEHVYCDITIPSQGASTQSAGASLHCRIQVLRVETTLGGDYGLACRIEEYSVSRWKPRAISNAGAVKLC